MTAETDWPGDEAALAAAQRRLAEARPAPWAPAGPVAVGGSYVCFARGASSGGVGQRGWAGAARRLPGRPAEVAVVSGVATAAYLPGRLALREGPLREAAVRALPEGPDVLLVDATGRDHPRRAGLALQLGAVLGVASVGVTDRPLVAAGAAPENRRGAVAPLRLGGEVVGYALRTRAGVRPLVVTAGWATTPQQAVDVVLRAATKARTPQPLRAARRAARAARGRAGA